MEYDRILSILDKVPGYQPGTPKRSRREIQEYLSVMEYDEEFISEINEDFCKGFGTAKEILAKLLSDQYWKGESPFVSEKEGF